MAALTVAAALLSACSASVTGQVTPAPAPPLPAGASRPNIVFILTDDLSRNLLPYLPHVQALQRAGTSLSNYYVVDSLCCPSRAAIFTGQYPHDDGVFTNTGPQGGYGGFRNNNDQSRTFAIALHRAGYRTGFMGKYLNGYFPYDPEGPGWDVWDGTGRAYREYNYALNENGEIHVYGHRPKDYFTTVMARKATSFIRAAGSSGRPFALEVATFAPHAPSVPAPSDVGTFRGLRAPRNQAYDRSPVDAPRWLASIPPLTPRDNANINYQFRRRVQSVQAVDRMVGRVERTLRAEGLAQNTYLVFSSDNGYHMGEYRLRPGKQTAFDTDVRVPLIVSGPGVPAGATVPQLASNIDLAPTFEQLAHAQIPPSVDGVSLVPLWHGAPPSSWQNAVLVEHVGKGFGLRDPDRQGRSSGDPPTYEAVRTADALYVRYATGASEYYDTTSDPLELDNQASTAPAGTLDPLRRTLVALEHCHGTSACQAASRAP